MTPRLHSGHPPYDALYVNGGLQQPNENAALALARALQETRPDEYNSTAQLCDGAIDKEYVC